MANVIPLVGALIGLLVYALFFFIIWKFYLLFEKIGKDISGIREAMERNHPDRPNIL